MKSLKWTVSLLLICLAILYYIGRMNYENENSVNIDSYVYFLTILSVVLIAALPRFWRSSSSFSIALALAFGAYFSCKLLFFKISPLFGWRDIYLSIIEMILFTLIICLAIRLSGILKDFDEAVEEFVISGLGNRVRSLRDGIEEGRIEVIRSRRYSRPLGLIVVEPEQAQSSAPSNIFVKEVQHAMMSRYVFSQVGKVLSGLMRRTDRILAQREKGRFVILCPETTPAHSKKLIKRIQTSVVEHLNVSVSCGMSSFPDESYTFEDLIKKAESHLIPSPGITAENTPLPLEKM